MFGCKNCRSSQEVLSFIGLMVPKSDGNMLMHTIYEAHNLPYASSSEPMRSGTVRRDTDTILVVVEEPRGSVLHTPVEGPFWEIWP
ncbi:hypothetical protein TgHK011_005855 [Trichoderma gracile]|nr:hypothetical protein TgHK011_005855 [Trichoderma gracile]